MTLSGHTSENRLKTGRRKLPRTAYKPGQSGNPGGRPKRTQQEYNLIAACVSKTPEAMETILSLMHSADKDSVKLAAATYIVEWGHGKPRQWTEDTRSPLDDTSTEVLLEMKRIAEQRIANYNQGKRMEIQDVLAQVEGVKALSLPCHHSNSGVK